jgi:sRNA-binding carbon storage regulator CsrA
MLVLTRREGEYLELSLSTDAAPELLAADLFKHGPIRVHITEVRPGAQIRIGVEAPLNVIVLRSELKCRFNQINAETES